MDAAAHHGQRQAEQRQAAKTNKKPVKRYSNGPTQKTAEQASNVNIAVPQFKAGECDWNKKGDGLPTTTLTQNRTSPSLSKWP
jgi:hypothetical protein